MYPYLRFQFDESIITFRRSYLQLQHNGRMIRRKHIGYAEVAEGHQFLIDKKARGNL